jgi:hypothetical protein
MLGWTIWIVFFVFTHEILACFFENRKCKWIFELLFFSKNKKLFLVFSLDITYQITNEGDVDNRVVKNSINTVGLKSVIREKLVRQPYSTSI